VTEPAEGACLRLNTYCFSDLLTSWAVSEAWGGPRTFDPRPGGLEWRKNKVSKVVFGWCWFCFLCSRVLWLCMFRLSQFEW